MKKKFFNFLCGLVFVLPLMFSAGRAFGEDGPYVINSHYITDMSVDYFALGGDFPDAVWGKCSAVGMSPLQNPRPLRQTSGVAVDNSLLATGGTQELDGTSALGFTVYTATVFPGAEGAKEAKIVVNRPTVAKPNTCDFRATADMSRNGVYQYYVGFAITSTNVVNTAQLQYQDQNDVWHNIGQPVGTNGIGLQAMYKGYLVQADKNFLKAVDGFIFLRLRNYHGGVHQSDIPWFVSIDGFSPIGPPAGP